MNTQFSLDLYIEWIEEEARKGSTRFDLFSADYVRSHAKRYEKTIDLISRCGQPRAALEIGATDFFQVYLSSVCRAENIWASIFSSRIEDKYYTKYFDAAGFACKSQVVSLNLENELFPTTPETFDIILFCEVIEHLDIDPMFCLYEINRIMRHGGYLVLTTPNSCSSRIAYKTCLGHRPHFYMQYEKDRSPYRHNFEYDCHALVKVLESSGFAIEIIETHDVFEPTWQEALDFLSRNNMPLENRGDDIFVLARKVGDPTERWPEGIYV